MLGNGDSEEICAIYVDAPQLAHAVNRVVDSVVVLGETGAGDKVVDLSVLLDDLVNTLLNRVCIRYIGVMSGDLGHSGGARVLLAEHVNQLDSLAFGFFLCLVGDELSAIISLRYSSPQICRGMWESEKEVERRAQSTSQGGDGKAKQSRVETKM